MDRILLRAHKDPFRVVEPRTVLKRNLIGDNVGNLLFSNAAYKLLDTRRAQITTSVLKGGAEEAARLNGEVDHVVIPLANAFRLSYQGSLDAMSETIEALTVPVTVLGVGAQLNLDGAVHRLDGIRDSVKRFVSAVLDKSPTIGVRGEFTESYLKGLGFRDVDVIGCPSLFLHGPDLRVVKRTPSIARGTKISLNISPYVKGLGPFVERHVAKYPRMQYAAQHRDALAMLLGEKRKDVLTGGPLPIYDAHPLVASGRTKMFVDPEPWMEHLSSFYFSFGTRIHGNIAALLAGTPAYVLAHDSRTLELARYYDIPHRTMDRITGETDVAELYDEADYSAFNANHRARFEATTDFFHAHGLRHVYEQGEDPRSFDRRIAATNYPAGVGGREAPHMAFMRRVRAIRRAA